MKIILNLSIYLLFCTNIIAQNKIVKHYDDGSIKSISHFNKKGEKDGKHIEFYINGEKKFEINYSNGNLDGDSKYFYPTGILKKRKSYKDNKYNGISTLYYINGKTRYKSTKKRISYYYNDGSLQSKKNKRNGHYIAYHKNGNLSKENIFNKSGEEIISKSYYADGTLAHDYNTKNKLEFYYYKNGALSQRNLYKNHRKSYKKYHENGKLLETLEGSYIDSRKKKYQSTKNKYNKQGELIESLGMVNDKIITKMIKTDSTTEYSEYKSGYKYGKFTSYYNSNNKIATKGEYFHNTKSGIWKEYYNNNTLKFEGEFIPTKSFNKIPNGTHTHYFINSNLRKKEFYKLSKKKSFATNDSITSFLRDKKWEEFYSNGNLKSLKHYYNGRIEGKEISFYKNGDTLEVKNYVNGIINGKHKKFFPNGKLEYSSSYRNGIQKGEHKEYYKSGNIRIEGFYKANDIKIGIWNYYYKNGKYAMVVEDLNNGNKRSTTYYPTGNKQCEVNTYYYDHFTQSKKDFSIYDDKGNQTTFYDFFGIKKSVKFTTLYVNFNEVSNSIQMKLSYLEDSKKKTIEKEYN